MGKICNLWYFFYLIMHEQKMIIFYILQCYNQILRVVGYCFIKMWHICIDRNRRNIFIGLYICEYIQEILNQVSSEKMI